MYTISSFPLSLHDFDDLPALVPSAPNLSQTITKRRRTFRFTPQTKPSQSARRGATPLRGHGSNSIAVRATIRAPATTGPPLFPFSPRFHPLYFLCYPSTSLFKILSNIVYYWRTVQTHTTHVMSSGFNQSDVTARSER